MLLSFAPIRMPCRSAPKLRTDSIGIAGQASIDKVAGPVGEALIMTAIGLAVAVPAVLGYNWLVRRNKVNMESVRNFGADVHGVLMGASMKTTAR